MASAGNFEKSGVFKISRKGKGHCRTQHAGQLRKMKISKHLGTVVVNQYFRESKSVLKMQHFKLNIRSPSIVEPEKAKECF